MSPTPTTAAAATSRSTSGAKLVLGTDINPNLATPARGGVTGGTVTVNSGGELDLTGGNTLAAGALVNNGQVNVSGTGNLLDAETVSNTGNATAIDITGALTLKDGSTIVNKTATSGETVESGASLTLQDTRDPGRRGHQQGGR